MAEFASGESGERQLARNQSETRGTFHQNATVPSCNHCNQSHSTHRAQNIGKVLMHCHTSADVVNHNHKVVELSSGGPWHRGRCTGREACQQSLPLELPSGTVPLPLVTHVNIIVFIADRGPDCTVHTPDRPTPESRASRLPHIYAPMEWIEWTTKMRHHVCNLNF